MNNIELLAVFCKYTYLTDLGFLNNPKLIALKKFKVVDDLYYIKDGIRPNYRLDWKDFDFKQHHEVEEITQKILDAQEWIKLRLL